MTSLNRRKLLGAINRTPTAIMKHIVFILSFALFITVLVPYPIEARACFNWPAIFKENRKIFEGTPKDKRILILPFLNKSNDARLLWLSEALRLGLFLTLENAKNTDVIEVQSQQTTFDTDDAVTLGRAVGADYVIAGQYRANQGKLLVFVNYVDVSGKKLTPIEEEVIEWPSTKKFSELVIQLARRASKAFKNIRINKKVLQLTEHRVRTIPALQYWVLGQIADETGTEKEIEKARDFFQNAIKNDFNYCYGYMGLAQTLAEIGFMAKLKNLPHKEFLEKAQKELTKVILLCPGIAEKWGKRVMQYIEADALQISATGLMAAGNQAKARKQLSQAVELLPGDVSSIKALIRAGGAVDRGLLQSLTSCN